MHILPQKSPKPRACGRCTRKGEAKRQNRPERAEKATSTAKKEEEKGEAPCVHALLHRSLTDGALLAAFAAFLASLSFSIHGSTQLGSLAFCSLIQLLLAPPPKSTHTSCSRKAPRACPRSTNSTRERERARGRPRPTAKKRGSRHEHRRKSKYLKGSQALLSGG